MRSHALTSAATTSRRWRAGADLIVLAAPVRAEHSTCSRAAATPCRARRSSPTSAARSGHRRGGRAALPPRLRFIGGHPLAGAAVGGIEAARADLFDGRPWLLTPPTDATGDDVRAARARSSPASARTPRRIGAGRARSAARRPQPSAAAHRQRADARGRASAPATTGSRWPAAGCATRPGWRRARRTSGATSPRPTSDDVGARARRPHRACFSSIRATISTRRRRARAACSTPRHAGSACSRREQPDHERHARRPRTRTYLEMRDPAELRPARLPTIAACARRACSTVRRVLAVSLRRSRPPRTTGSIGSRGPTTRSARTWREPAVSIWLLTVAGTPAGYFELRRDDDGGDRDRLLRAVRASSSAAASARTC